jgi:MFS family permease
VARDGHGEATAMGSDPSAECGVLSAHGSGSAVFHRDNAALLALVCVYSFFAASLISVASPFLPQGLLSVGASEALIGAVFAAYPAMNLVLSPLCTPACAKLGRCAAERGKQRLTRSCLLRDVRLNCLLQRPLTHLLHTRRRVFVLGIVLEAIAAVVMGCVPTTPGSGAIYLLLRCAQGTGAALSYTALLASCADRFRGGLATLVGLQEAVAGVGFMVGPPIGGGLYALGGFRLPFVVMGVGLLVCLPLLPWALPRVERELTEASGAGGQPVTEGAAATPSSGATLLPGFVQHPELSFMAVARLPAVLNASLVTLLAGLAFGFIGPTLAPHLQETLHASERATGGLFGLAAGTYALASPGAGALADAYGPKRILAIGIAGLALSYIFLGPSPLLGPAASHGVATPGAWALQCISLSLLGFSAALAFIPCMPAMEAAVLARFGDSPACGETVAALYNGIYCAGEALGPLAGAAMTGAMGFKWASTAIAGILFAYCLCLVAVELYKRRAGPGSSMTASLGWRAAAAAAARSTRHASSEGWARFWRKTRGGRRAGGVDTPPLWESLLDDAVDGDEDEGGPVWT